MKIISKYSLLVNRGYYYSTIDNTDRQTTGNLRPEPKSLRSPTCIDRVRQHTACRPDLCGHQSNQLIVPIHFEPINYSIKYIPYNIIYKYHNCDYTITIMYFNPTFMVSWNTIGGSRSLRFNSSSFLAKSSALLSSIAAVGRRISFPAFTPFVPFSDIFLRLSLYLKKP